MAVGFKKAKREKLWVKVLLAGPSGSGKTYSALRLATGMAEEIGSRIAYIDTENGRVRYYASEFDFDDMQFEAPFTPELYISAIDAAVEGGYKVLVIDSLTHEWDYCLDIHNKMSGNSYTNWGKITPRHDAFMEKVLQSPLHIFATVRGKDEYVLEEKNGKQAPKKVGIGYKQRDNLEYNYTVTFNLAQDTHIAESTKDNTHIFEGRYEVLTEKDGRALYAWANSGSDPAPKPNPVKAPETATIDDVFANIKDLIDELKALGVTRDTIGDTIANVCGMKNYLKITDFSVAEKTLNELKSLKENA